MNVSFTGIKNASAVLIQNSSGNRDENYIVNAQLTDDENGKELTEFKKLINRYGEELENPFMKNFIHISTISETPNSPKTLIVNGKPIFERDDNLPIFSFIAKITKKIYNMKDNDLKIDANYMKSYYADEALLFGNKMSTLLNKNAPDCLAEFHHPTPIKGISELINNQIQDMMNKYFNII